MKRITNDPFVWICIGALLFFCVHFIGKFWEESALQPLNDAQMSYISAERTKVISERQEGFNRSLEFFLELEKKYEPTFGNGKLYFDIGNNFFQLEEYPQALLYYYRAQLLRPSDEKVKTHIELAQKKLGLSAPSKAAAFDWLFYFHNHYSLPERLQFLAILIIVTFLLVSLCLWFSNRFLYGSTMAVGALAALMTLSISYSYLFSPLEGVVIKSTLLYRDAGTQYAKVKPDPLAAGLKVQLHDVALGGKWVKIETDDGTVGYLPQEALESVQK